MTFLLRYLVFFLQCVVSENKLEALLKSAGRELRFEADSDIQERSQRKGLSLLSAADEIALKREKRRLYVAEYRAKNKVLLAEKRKAKWREGHPFPSRGPLKHGTSAMYVSGCRCDECKAAHATYNRLHRTQNPSSTRASRQTSLARRKSRTTAELLSDQKRLRPDGMKICRACKENKPLAKFYRDKGAPDGHGTECASCNRKIVMARRKKETLAYWQQHGIAYRFCYLCEDLATQADHVMPRKLGGEDHPRNLMPICKTCNRSKWASHPKEFFTRLTKSSNTVQQDKAEAALLRFRHLFE